MNEQISVFDVLEVSEDVGDVLTVLLQDPTGIYALIEAYRVYQQECRKKAEPAQNFSSWSKTVEGR